MNYMNQMNPMLMQQQMIYQMQYRQPYYNHQHNRQVTNKKNYKKPEGEAQAEDKADTHAVPVNQFDEATIQQKLEMIKKMVQD